jgi:hypothetical protein
MRAAALLILLLSATAGCLSDRPDPVWMTGNCGEALTWHQPGIYDAAPDEVEEPAKRRELAPQLQPTLPFEGAKPYVAMVLHWSGPAAARVSRAPGGEIILQVPTGTPGPREGRAELDAFLQNLTLATPAQRAAWLDELERNAGMTGWSVALPAVDIERFVMEMNALAPREVSGYGGAQSWSWTVPSMQPGLLNSVILELADTRPSKQYAWTEGRAFVVSVSPGDLVFLSAARAPDAATVADAFARMGLPAPPPAEAWAQPTTPTSPTVVTPSSIPHRTEARCIRV